MIANLPMYDRPETQAANDRLWAGVRAALGVGPKALSRDMGLTDVWTSPDLILSQTCSLPYRLGLYRHVDIVASPIHDLPCAPGHYLSALVVRQDDPRQTVAAFKDAPLAINGWDSQSGWAAVCDVSQNVRHVTGSHRASAQAVADGEADLAAIDAVSWTMIRRWDGFAAQLRVLGTTPATPALPFVTAKGNDTARLFAALALAIAALTPEDRTTLCLTGVTELADDTYRALPIPPNACHSPQNP